MRNRLALAAREPLTAWRALRRFVSITSRRVAHAPASVYLWPKERAERAAGEAAWRARQFDAAHDHFETATRYGTHPWSWLRYARSAVQRDEIDVAYDAISRALAIAPATPSVRLEILTLLKGAAPRETVAALVDEFERARPGTELAFLGRAFAERGDADRAREIGRRLATKGEKHDATVVEALALHAEGRRDDARARVEHVTGRGRGTVAARARLLLDLDEPLLAWSALAPAVDDATTTLVARCASALSSAGELTLASNSAHIAATRTPPGRGAAQVEQLCASELADLRDGVTLHPSDATFTHDGDPNTVMYLLQNSLPYMSGGYATRSHGLLRALAARGREVHAITRPGYPYGNVSDPTTPIAVADTIDGVEYRRIGEPRAYDLRDNVGFCEAYVSFIEPLARREQVGIVHAASFYWNGIVANTLKQRLDVPSVYEVRGLGELTRSSRNPRYAATEGHALMVRLETQAASGADAVITITGALRDELVRRGIDAEKIVVVPNGVDTARFTPIPRDEQLEAAYGLAHKRVLGFVGTLLDYEGLDLLLRATARLSRTHDDFHVLIVGSGRDESGLRALTTELALDDIVTFTGRVSHSEVERYLSLTDITPFPRHAVPVCEMVSPLKPLESMASGKVVVASSVAALAEMVDDGRTGLVFEKESLDDLTRVLDVALSDASLRERLATTARAWVAEERSWHALSGRVESLYDALLSGTPVNTSH